MISLIGIILLIIGIAYVNADTILTNLGTDTPYVNTGQGDNELYDMDQNVLTTSNVTFDNMTADIITDGTITCESGSCTGGSDSNYTNHYQNGVKVLDIDDNTTMTSYVDAQDVVYNSSMKTYVDVQDIVYNDSMTTYADTKLALTGGTLTGNTDCVDCNVTADNIFIKSDIFVHSDSTQSVASAGTWYNITFTHESDIKQGITHTYNDNTNDTITIVNTGVYDIKFAGNLNDTSVNPDDYAYMRIVANGVEINGSGMQSYISKQYAHVIVSGCVRADLTAGDEIKLQFTGTSTDTNLEAQDGYLDHSDSARMCLQRIR